MNLNKELPKLVKEGVITPQIAEDILNYYQKDKEPTQNRLMMVFSVIGAILIGLGIILILAHNWDNFSRSIKIGLSLLPLLLAQIACGYTLVKKKDSQAWREASTSFLFFAIGSCISLISQIYNIPGNMGAFLLSWMLLFLPIPFIMKSSVGSLLFIVGSSVYAMNNGYWEYKETTPYMYCVLMASVIPFYYGLIKNRPESNGLIFHNWLIPLSLIICLGTLANENGHLMYLAYMSLFATFCLLGRSAFFKEQKLRNNGYLTLGLLGSIFILLLLSFGDIWVGIRKDTTSSGALLLAPEFYTTLILACASLFLAYTKWAKKELRLDQILFLFVILIFILDTVFPVGFILVNLLLFAFGLLTILSGTKLKSLKILNSGLLIITALIACRFFDTDLSFVTRGILFLSLGLGFFIANYQLLKEKKQHA